MKKFNLWNKTQFKFKQFVEKLRLKQEISYQNDLMHAAIYDANEEDIILAHRRYRSAVAQLNRLEDVDREQKER